MHFLQNTHAGALLNQSIAMDGYVALLEYATYVQNPSGIKNVT